MATQTLTRNAKELVEDQKVVGGQSADSLWSSPDKEIWVEATRPSMLSRIFGRLFYGLALLGQTGIYWPSEPWFTQSSGLTYSDRDWLEAYMKYGLYM
jgi:hypothetical protein